MSVLCVTGVAGAQENLDQGKSPAQLFASNCAICHKSPRLAKAGEILGLDSFLREHYTASKELAGALAAYSNRWVRVLPRRAARPNAARRAMKKPSPTRRRKRAPRGATRKGRRRSRTPPRSQRPPIQNLPRPSPPLERLPTSLRWSQSPVIRSLVRRAAGETKPPEGGKSEKSD